MKKTGAQPAARAQLNADLGDSKLFPQIEPSETLALWHAALAANGDQPMTIAEALKSIANDERALRRHTVNSLSLIGSRQLLPADQHKGKTAYRAAGR